MSSCAHLPLRAWTSAPVTLGHVKYAMSSNKEEEEECTKGTFRPHTLALIAHFGIVLHSDKGTEGRSLVATTMHISWLDMQDLPQGIRKAT